MKLIDYFVFAHLVVIGIAKNQRYKSIEKYLQMLMIGADICIFISFVVVFPQAKLFIHQCSIVTTVLGAAVFFLHRCFAYSKKQHLLRILKILENDPPYFGGNRVRINTDAKLSQNFYPTVKKVIFFLVFATIMPYAYLFYSKNLDYNDPTIYVIPYLYHFRDVDTLSGFLFIQFLQALTIGHFAAIYFSFVGFINYVMSNIKAHIIELNVQFDSIINDYIIYSDSLKNPSIRRNISHVTISNKDDQNSINHRFIKIVKYQLFIQRYIKDFADFIGSILSYYVLQFVFLAFGFTLLGAQMIDNNVGVLLQNLSVLVNLLYGFYTWCDVCETISHMNEGLLRSFYLTQWYELPTETRKILIATMTHTQRARTIRAFGVFTINFGLGLQVLKIIYSLVNLLALKGRSLL